MNDAEVSIKFNNKVTGEAKLQKYAETLTKINSILNGLNTGVMAQLESSASSIKNISSDTHKLSAAAKGAFNISVITRYANAIKRLGTAFATLSKQSFDFLENLNLFAVAFQENGKKVEDTTREARKFTNALKEMYGLDESWLIRTTGKFKQLANAMGIGTETGTKLSQLLTQMSLDISSLYNVDFDKAASTLSSAMAGQTKPIRGVAGADITQGTLQTTLDNLGIDRMVSELSFAEKRLLIVISLTQQLNKSVGDLGRTIESPANQLRVLSEQWATLTRNIGNMFLPILAKILPYLNAILMVLSEIIKMLATLFGFTEDDAIGYASGLDDITDSTEKLSTGLGSAAKNAKKLKQGLRGFDKLNVITTPTKASASGGAGGGGIGGIDPKLLKEFDKAFDSYQKKLKNVTMEATKIRDKIMEWLGFTKIVDEKTGDVTFKLKEGYTKLHLIRDIIKGLIGLKIIAKIVSLALNISKISKVISSSKFLTSLKTLGTTFTTIAKVLGVSVGTLGLIVAAIAGVIVAFVECYKTNDIFREKVDKLVDSLKTGLKPILNIIKNAFETLTKVVKSLYNNAIKPLVNLISKILQPIFEAVVNVLQKMIDKINPIIKKLDEKIMPIISDIGDFLETTIFPALNSIWKVIGKIFEALSPIMTPILTTALTVLLAPILLVLSAVSKIYDVVDYLYKNIVKPFLNWVTDKINKYVIPAIESIGNVVDKIKKAIQKVVDWWNNLSFNKKKIKVESDTGSSGGGHSGGGGRQGASGGVFTPNGQKLDVRNFALGGIPPVGQMFIAREKGPELVGKIGNHTAVINNDQIVSSVASGVYDAVYKANTNSRSSQPINPTIIVQVGNKEIAKQVITDLQDMAKTNGRPITIGG